MVLTEVPFQLSVCGELSGHQRCVTSTSQSLSTRIANVSSSMSLFTCDRESVELTFFHRALKRTPAKSSSDDCLLALCQRVLRGEAAKDYSGSHAVLTEHGSSASLMTAATVQDVIFATVRMRRRSTRRCVRTRSDKNWKMLRN